MMRRVMTVVFLVAGCAPLSVSETCDAYMAAYCKKVEACIPSASCDPQTGNTCSQATELGKDWPTCDRDLAAQSCGDFFDGVTLHLPASCVGLFVGGSP